MRHRTAVLFGLACLALVLKGDSCLVEERTTDVVITADVPAIWQTEGTNNTGTDTYVVDAGDEILEALDDLGDDADLTEINIAGVCYEVLQNNGFDGAHEGSVSVDGNELLTFEVQTNATGTKGGTEEATVRLSADGVNYVNSLLDQFLASYNAGNPDPSLLNDLEFVANWSSTPPGATGYDFDWKTCLILQVIGEVTVDVPNP
jgi:hypothetical protein